MDGKQRRAIRNAHGGGWLRAAVLGANDGIVSTAALVVGVAATGASREVVLTSGVAGAVAGAMSMAAGEYVSVKSQQDAEQAALARERHLLEEDPREELDKLASVYERRGLDPDLALTVARQLTRKDAMRTHTRDVLGITETLRARPIPAALSSALTFTVGSLLPLSGAFFASGEFLRLATFGLTVMSLLLTGALAARIGGAPLLRGALRLVFWGSLAMLATELVGRLLK